MWMSDQNWLRRVIGVEKCFQVGVLSAAVVLANGALANSIESNTSNEGKLEVVSVYGEPGKTDTATTLNLTIFETPQTVTSISRLQLDDFALNTVNDALNYAPGVTVEEVETGRTYYTARGFDIVNFQYDGVGVPFTYGNFSGALDTASFEKVEVVKGAAGLITGLANPSATINYVRKRPTEDLQMSTRLSADEWGGQRVDADVTGAITDSVRGRLVVAKESSDTYLDRHESDTDVFYGIIDADLSDNTLLTIGHSYMNNRLDGVFWGALPLIYSDGSLTNYDVSSNTAPDWTYTENESTQTFVELKHQLSDNWSINAAYNRNKVDADEELFYVSGAPDPVTEVGLSGWASAYKSTETQDVYDIYAAGSVELGGRSHDLVIGYNRADIETKQDSFIDPINSYQVLGGDWAQGNTPRPRLTTPDSGSDIKQTHKAFYLSSRWSLTDELSLLLGARQVDMEQRGESYGAPADTDAKDTVPYYGVTYQILDDVMLYASYSEVFAQQAWVAADYSPLGATTGDSTEFGVKKSFNDGRAILTLAVFESEFDNLGEYAYVDDNNVNIYEARNFESQGYEVEFSGELVDGLNLSAGFTKVDIDGDSTRPFVPAKQAKVAMSYRLPQLPELKLVGAMKWQDDITTADKLIEQGAYSLFDLAAHYDVTPELTLSVNVENVTDKKYLSSLYWDQAFYGAPRNVSASLNWKY